MEVASYLSNKAASVIVVGTGTYPYERSLGPEIGKMCMQVRNNGCWNPEITGLPSCIFLKLVLDDFFYQRKLVFSFQMLEEQQVKFHMNSSVMEIQGANGKVSIIIFSSKQEQL